jgi:hypothetical protein
VDDMPDSSQRLKTADVDREVNESGGARILDDQ